MVISPAGEPLQPLGQALTLGQAFFAGSPVQRVDHASSRAVRRLRSKASTVFEAFPEVAVGDCGVTHTTSGLTFVDLEIAGTSYLAGCGETAGWRIRPGIPIQIVTGMCLFGAESVIGWSGQDAFPITVGPVVHDENFTQPIDQVTADARWHVYEVETIERLGSFIGALARLPGLGPILVQAHIPGPEYEAVALSLYARGLLPADLCARYREMARHRAGLIGEILERRLGAVAQVRVSSPLSVVGGLDVQGIRPAEVTRILYEAFWPRDRLWRALLAGTAPSIKAVIRASYVYHYLCVARDAQRQGHQLLLAENPDEEKIFRCALRDCSRTGISLDGMRGFYLHPQVVVTRTAFGYGGSILRDCQDGCEPRTVAAAGWTDWDPSDPLTRPVSRAVR